MYGIIELMEKNYILIFEKKRLGKGKGKGYNEEKGDFLCFFQYIIGERKETRYAEKDSGL